MKNNPLSSFLFALLRQEALRLATSVARATSAEEAATGINGVLGFAGFRPSFAGRRRAEAVLCRAAKAEGSAEASKDSIRQWRIAPRLAAGCFIFLAVFFLAGCVGYRLGSTLPPDIKTVYVPIFANKSREPLVENDATAAAIAELQKDGTLKVVNAENADVILECTITGVSLNPLRYDRTDVTKPNEYRLTLSASFTLKRVRDREVLCEASVIGEATFPFFGNLVSAKQSAMPRAAEDLAKRIVEKAIEAW